MRIAIDVRALMEGKMTGVQEYITKLLRMLFTIDQDNHYLLFANSFSQVSNRVRIFDYPNVEYRIFHYPNKIFNLLLKTSGCPRLENLLGKVDLIFSPHWRIMPPSPLVPLVITFHDLSYEVYPDFFTRRQRFWHAFMNYRQAARKATRLIAVSESTKLDLMRLYHVPEKKIKVIYSGIDLSPVAEALPGLPEKYFLSLATFEPRKNFENLIAAYKDYLAQGIEGCPLVLAGSRGWKTKIRIPSFLRNKIFLFPDVSEPQKKYLYQHALAFLFLSFYEGFGFPILEAASQGLPVVSSSSTSLIEIGSGFAIFVNPFRPSQVTKILLTLEKDVNYCENLKAKGLAAAKKYQWKDAARQTLELFQTLCV
jgi:glycosyltransferase involved in cell wall biosynthesis